MKKLLYAALAALFTFGAFTSCTNNNSSAEYADTGTREEYAEQTVESASARVGVSDMKFTVNGKELWINGANTLWQNWNDFWGIWTRHSGTESLSDLRKITLTV